MDFWNQISIGSHALLIVWAAIVGLWLIKVVVSTAARLIERMMLPAERAALQWLQDRATSRTLGINIDVIRVRRKSQFPKVTGRAG